MLNLPPRQYEGLKPYEGFSLNDIECLCCGTATPDQLMPGHGLMVHGELKSGPCEVVSTAGVCISGMTSLKYAYMNVALGLSKNAVASGLRCGIAFSEGPVLHRYQAERKNRGSRAKRRNTAF